MPIRKVIQSKNSVIVIIPKAFAEQAGMTVGSYVDFRIDQKTIIINPVRPNCQEECAQGAAKNPLKLRDASE